MPIYEYHCPRCGVNFEKLVDGRVAKGGQPEAGREINAGEPEAGREMVRCPSCESREVTRRLSLFRIPVGSAGFAASSGGGGSCGCGAGGCGCH